MTAVQDPETPAPSEEERGGFDLDAFLCQFDPRMLEIAECRRELCRYEPLLFGLLYLSHHLRGTETGEQITFSEFHIDLFEQAKRWALPDDEPAQNRDGYVAPRGAGKSTLTFLVLPLWAAAFGHRKFIAAFADSASQAEMHLASFKRELTTNALLRLDFPDLCAPARKPAGTVESDNRAMLITKSGFVFGAKGIDSSSLGMKVGNMRPDLLLCHMVGTEMRTSDGTWAPVEQHPSFREASTRHGIEVTLHGIPESEVVTQDHRYWARRIEGAEIYDHGTTTWEPHARDIEPGWVEARNLTNRHWIGMPIDQTAGELQPVDFYAPTVVRDEQSGLIVTSTPTYQPRIPDEFRDPDWWWLFGLWWGDGSLSGRHQIGVTLNNNDCRVRARLQNLLKRYNICYTERPRQGCTQIIFSRGHLNRWLRTWWKAPSRKQPPAWVEQLPTRLLQEVVWGYVDADGFVDRAAQAVRVTSIHLPGLLALRRIMARLGAAASIRKSGGEPKPLKILGRATRSQQKYDLRVRQGAEVLGFPFADQDRYDSSTLRTFIADGMLWTRVKTTADAGIRDFAPIKTADSTYVTHFGLSHNCDDVEPDESNYSAYQKEKRLSTLIDAILPLNVYARVVLVGTVTMPGSIVHDLVKTITKPNEDAPAWIKEENWRVHYYPAIVTNEETGEERSLWPAKWPLEYLQSIRHTRAYKKNYANDPMARDGDYWNETDFVHVELPALTAMLLSIDPAVKSKKSSDFTALAVIGYSAHHRRCIVLDAWAIRVPPGAALRKRVMAILELYPQIRGIVVEDNQGGEVWDASVLHNMPVKLKTVGQHQPKEVRAARLLGFYQNRPRRIPGRPASPIDQLPFVVHARPLPALEEQMVGFPRAAHDDLVDAVGTGVDMFLKKRKKEGIERHMPGMDDDEDDLAS